MSEWKPISTAPRDGSSVLLWYPDLRCGCQVGSFHRSEHLDNGKVTYSKEYWSIGLMSMGNAPEPSHWMPLPSGPDERGGFV